MKKLFPLFALFAIILVGCIESKVDTTNEIILNVETTTTDLLIGDKGLFKITSSEKPNTNLTIEVTSSDIGVLTVQDVIILSGTKEVTGEFTGVKAGKATITISCKADGVSIKKSSFEIIVSDNIESIPEVYVPKEGTFIKRLEGATISGRKAVGSINKVTNGLSGLFKEGRYMIEFNQPIDHANKSSEIFTQRVIVAIAAYDSPVVFVTQGYGFGDGWSFEDSSYKEELVDILKCNQVIVEHRFFEESAPSIIDWKHHTIENQVNDLHRINLVMREIFKDQKFISTGRSKGGQTAIYYEALFPKDIDIAVPYVAPICYQLGDMRHAEFLKNVGSDSRRKAIKELQQEMFNRRDKLVPLFKSQNSYLDFNASIDVIFDLCVLEYSFMCWQYDPSSSIPSTSLSDNNLLYELGNKSGASYFSNNYNQPFMVNVRHDIGYYSYDVKQFTNTVITQAEADRWIEDISTSKYASNIEFNPAMGQKVKTFLENNTTEKMMFIYGEYDTWSAAAVDQSFFTGKTNMFRYDLPGGDHSTFIGSFNSSTENKIVNQLKAWLAE